MSTSEKILVGLEYVALVLGCAFIGFSSIELFVVLHPPDSWIVVGMGGAMVVVLCAIFVLKALNM